MSDPIPLANIIEETPSGSVSRVPSHLVLDTAISKDADKQHPHPPPQDNHPPTTPKTHHGRPRRGSSVSRVSVGYFDPQGVLELRRTLTHDAHTQALDHPVTRTQSASTRCSDVTLTGDLGEKSFDFERTVRRIVKKRNEAEIPHRELGVVFRELGVVGLGASHSYQPTLGSLFNPLNVIESIQKLRHPPVRDILSGFEGVVKPGEMLLVLGSPGSGCSTLLKTIANQRKEYYSVTGDVHYDSITPEELKNHFRGDVQYCPEDDIHFPTLSVEQTINFAVTTRTPRDRIEYTRSQFTELTTTILTTVFGLRHARKTPVGDASVRGVSGGEKKRVSIAEALASRACIGSWDNSTRGLDASTALEFVRALRIATDTMRITTIVSIYQAGESLYKHFDKVCVIYQGKMAYFGPADRARDYFIEMGYEPVNRQTTADFLVAVTDPNARIPRAGITNQPRTADEFAEYFKRSKAGMENVREVDDYMADYVGNPSLASAYTHSARAEFAKGSGKANPYILTIPQQLRAVMRRKVQIIAGNSLATGLNVFSFVFQSLIMGSVFLKMPEATNAFFSRGGVLFFALLFAAMTTMAEIPALYAQRPIILKHEHAALYHPFIEALAHTFVDIPIIFITLAIFAIILYFMTGLQKSADQFFIFFLFLVIMTITMKAWFRAIASAFKSEATAQTVAGISILALTIYTGYTIPKPSMIGALRWITYINPLRYGFEAIITNEFRTLQAECSSLVPQGAGYENVTLANQVCTAVGSQPGELYVDGSVFAKLSYGFEFANTWMNFGIVVAFGVGFIAALLIFSEYNTSLSTDTSMTLFKRGAKKVIHASTADEEKGASANTEILDEKVDNAPTATKEVIDHPRMTDIFTWQHIDYLVPISGEDDKKLLSDVSGYVAPGKLTALMGESGAGKTTLLNVLAKRVNMGIVSGDQFVNGQPLPADFQSQSGYCQQMDTHVPTATVREALLFSAKLRQPTSVPLAEKEAYVEKCLKMCGLEDYADAAVGSLSIEFKKRTTIGVELAAKPKLLLFLDEPTSGLDSQSAWAIVSFLRSLADQGQAILCTIHQPSAELFQVFDRMLLLRKGGQTVYFGDLGDHATTMIDYLERNGGRKCDPSENPAEYMLDVIGAGATASSVIDWHTTWKASPESVEVQHEIDTIHTEGRSRPAVEAAIHSEFATPWLFQAKELFLRNAEAYWRDPTYLMAKLTLNAVGGLFIGFTFYQAKDTLQGTQNKLFAIFMVTILSVPLSNQLQVPFINTRKIYEIRERPSRMYSWSALVTSQILIETPWNIIGSIILFFTWFWTVGFDNSRAGYTFLMLTIIFPLYYTTIGQAVAAMSPSAEIAAVLFSFLFSFVITFNGVLQPFRELGWWRWMYRLSPFTYLVEGLLGQALGRQEINCSSVELVALNPPSGQTCGQYMEQFISTTGGYLTNPSATELCQFCSMRTTDQFLMSSFNIDYTHRWRNVGIMVAFILFNTVMIYVFTYLFRIRTGSLVPSFLRRSEKQSKKQ